ncbi:MAG: hypothetical protein WC773_04695 [Patescibacteria group bacterium]
MSLGIVSRSFRRGKPHSTTVIDGVPVTYRPGTPRYVSGLLSASGDGLTYAGAKKTIQEAVTAAQVNDTIYIRPLALGSYYTESVIVPNTTRGLSIIGATTTKGGSVYQACTWRNSSNSVDDSALDWRAGHQSIENVHFFSRAAQERGFGIKAYWNTGSGLNIGSAIVNCGFSSNLADAPAAAGLVQSAIRFDSTEGQLVENCFFVDCRVSIAAGSTMNAWKEIVIKDNIFNGQAANIAADLFLADGLNLAVVGNHFGHIVPAHAAGTMQKFIFVIGGATVHGLASGNYFGSANAGYGTDNTNHATIIRSGNFYSGGIMTS